MSAPTQAQILAMSDVARLTEVVRCGASAEVRAAALNRLATVGGEGAVSAFQGALTKDEDPLVIEAALAGLHRQASDRGKFTVQERLLEEVHVRLLGTYLKKLGFDVRNWLWNKMRFGEETLLPGRVRVLGTLYPDFMLSRCSELMRNRPHELRRWILGAMAGLGTTEAHRERILRMLQEMRRHYIADVRLGAIEGFWALRHEDRLALTVEGLSDDKIMIRARCVEILGKDFFEDLEPHLPRLLRDQGPSVQRTTIEVLAARGAEWLDTIRAEMGGFKGDAIIAACAVIQAHGGPEDLDILWDMVVDNTDHVRAAALRAARAVAPREVARRSTALLTADDLGTAQAAFESVVTGEEGTAEALVRAMRKIHPELVLPAMNWIQTHAPEHLAPAAARGLKHTNPAALGVLARNAFTLFPEPEPGLHRLMQSSDSGVRTTALQGLLKIVSDPDALALAHAQDPMQAIRLEVTKHLKTSENPGALDALLTLVRDADCEVRRESLHGLMHRDDPRVLSELVSSLNDIDSGVKNTAKDIFDGVYGEVPVIGGERAGRVPVWQRLRMRVDRINRWAMQIGQELLGKSVIVHQYRQGLGRTHASPAHSDRVEIEVTDTPVTSGHPHGEQIMMGLALHEIGHHLCDIGVRGHSAMRGIARSEKIKDIYDILIDERLERTLRSRRPEWGIYFDRLASYAFAQTAHRVPIVALADFLGRDIDAVVSDFEAKALPGVWVPEEDVVLLRDSDLLGIPGAVSLIQGFLWCLRCGFDPRLHPDPRVAQAVALVPAELRRMNHAELLEVCRAIGALIEHEDMDKGRMEALVASMGKMCMGGTMQRMADANMLPEGMIPDTPDIRKTPPPKTPESPKDSQNQSNHKRAGGWTLNLAPGIDFPEIRKHRTLKADHAAQIRLVGSVRKHVRRLRPWLERLGQRTIDERASRRGRRLDMVEARKAAWRPTANLLVHSRQEIHPDAYIGMIIDCSGSMSGERLERAQAFGALLAESAKGLRGIEGHIHGFDDDTLYGLGNFDRHAISALASGGGNNDSGALKIAVEMAMRSQKKNRLIIMISDGSPSTCTYQSLEALVKQVTREYGVVCAQVAVAPLSHIAFPHYVDLSAYKMEEAVARFGTLLMKLTGAWR